MHVIHGDPAAGLDALVVAAHPDDAEIRMGGTIARLTAAGYRIGLVDLTRGEAGSRGTPEERLAESRQSAEVLGVAVRVNLGLADGALRDEESARNLLVGWIRRFRSPIVFTHHTGDPHPDHTATHHLVAAAAHHAGLGRLAPGLPPFRPSYLFHFFMPHRSRPSFIVDITAHWPVKREAIACYQSQVSPRREGEPETWLNRPDFMAIQEAHGRSLGSLAGVGLAEAFHCAGLLLVEDPLAAFRGKGGRFL